MALIDLAHLGSFQLGIRRSSESPLDSLWRQIALFGHRDLLRDETGGPLLTDEDKLLAAYIVTRIRQAIEFRAALRSGSLLTSAVPHYYSLLNLTRACLALRKASPPTSRGHGLSYKPAVSILESRASIVEGTFQEYLVELGAQVPSGTAISLEECLSHVAEIAVDYSTVRSAASQAISVRVRGMQSGLVTLRLDEQAIGEPATFRSRWRDDFPRLASVCTIGPEGTTLQVKADVDTKSYEAIARFCSEHLEVDLLPRDFATWFIMRESGTIVLPRPAYYLCAMFILSNIARYEPESLMAELSPPSSTAWLLEGFLQAAERFFPNLLLNWVMKQNWFFGAA